MAEIQYLEINDITRMINVPVNLLLGVREDKDVKKLYFKCKKIVEENVDFSKHQIYVKYINALDKSGKRFDITDPKICLCGDVTTQGDYITFSWLMSESVFAKEGFIAFSVLASDGENTRWNTYPAIGTVLNSVPGGLQEVAGKYPDIITQLLNRMSEVEKIATKEAMQEYVNTYLTAHPGEIDETLTDSKKAAPADVVGQLKEDLDGLPFDISCGNNLFDITRISKGKIKQDGTIDGDNNSGHTDFIPVTEGDYMFVSKVGENYVSADVYSIWGYGLDKKTKRYLGNLTYTSEKPVKLSIPDDIRYVVLSLYNIENYKDIMFLTYKDTFPLVYVPYKRLVRLNECDYVTEEEFKDTRKILETVTEDFMETTINLEKKYIETAVISAKGEIKKTSIENFYVESFSCKSKKNYIITASTAYGNAYYAFLDETMIPIFVGLTAPEGSTPNSIVNENVIAPNGSAFLVVSGNKEAKPINVKCNDGYKKKGKWYGTKWLCLGDSLTEVNSRTTKHYHDYIAENTDIEVLNFGSSGTGYKRKEEEGKAFYQRIASMPIDIDVVTIFGSGNDLGGGYTLGNPTDTGTDTICGCINKTIDTVINAKPNVSIGIISPTPWVGNQPTTDDSNPMAQYVEAQRIICKIRSIPFLDLYHESNLRPWTEEGRGACYTKDNGNGVHPDETGHKIIAPRFKAFLEKLIL